MSVSLHKIIPQSVIAIGDDGNKPSNLFDESLETRWSYQGKFAYNLVTLSSITTLDSITFWWYMKKKENREYDFGIYLSDKDIVIPVDFEAAKNEVQKLYDDVSTIKPLSNNKGQETTTVKLNGRTAKAILIVYTRTSAKKDWFSLKEIAITGITGNDEGQCEDGKRWDPIAGDCLPIVDPDDQDHVDINGVTFFEEDGIQYLSENHSFHTNYRPDGSMRMDFIPSDMGNKYRPDREMLIFIKCQKTKATERVNAKFNGGPHNDEHPKLGRCDDWGIQMDAKKVIFEQELWHVKMEKRDEIDISHLNLSPLSNNFYGLYWRDRRVLKEDDHKLLGRIMEMKVNPNPFDNNRNVINANWVDVAVFIDKGQYKDDKNKPYPIIEGPIDPSKYQDTVRVDGQNASTFLTRFPRHCGIKPIIVKDAVAMDELFNKLRHPGEIPPDGNKAPVVKLAASTINVTADLQEVTLDASGSTDPNGDTLNFQWKQMSGAPIEVSPLALIAPSLSISWKKEFETSDWQVSVRDVKGMVSTGVVKVINAINQNPEDTKYIEPKYNADISNSGLYFRLKDYVKGKNNLADGIRVDSDAKKWDLSVKSNGSVYYNASGIGDQSGTGRLKIYAKNVLSFDELMALVEKDNPEWSYDKARQLGAWGGLGFGNVEATAVLTFDKDNAKKDAFLGWVARSCFHDLKTDPESKNHQHRYHGGSAYHSNIQIGGTFEEKIEGGHAIYYEADKILTYMTNVPNLAGKKVGWKWCLQNTMFENNPIVLSQTYLTLHPDDTHPSYAPWWSTIYRGDECPSKSIQKDNKNVDKLDVDPGLITWQSQYIILKTNDSKMTLHDIEIKPIVPLPEVTNI
jgi:hypothetical protein